MYKKDLPVTNKNPAYHKAAEQIWTDDDEVILKLSGLR